MRRVVCGESFLEVSCLRGELSVLIIVCRVSYLWVELSGGRGEMSTGRIVRWSSSAAHLSVGQIGHGAKLSRGKWSYW
jgi:hypothetical protein